MNYHPIFLDLRDKRTVVIGGGHLATLKVEELRQLGALVTVVTDAPSREIDRLAATGAIALTARPYRDGDLAGAWLAFAAAGDPAVHARVRAEADRERIWLNAVDDVPNCSFIAGSVHRVGDVVVSVTTSGACPALAVRLRQTIARLVGPEHGRFTRLAAKFRRRVARRIPDFETRRRFWYSVVDSPALGLFRQGRDREARRRFHELLRAAESAAAPAPAGRVILVGAGPGDPGLITAVGLAWLRTADVVIHDRLVHPALLREVRPDATLIDVGKVPRGPFTSQERIHELLVEHATAGKLVVRLKGGDPFVFGRGAEEVAALEAAGIPTTVISGVTSAIAAPAAAGIPVTRRGVAGGFAVVTGHDAADSPPIDWAALAAMPTLVVLMGRERLAELTGRLIAEGRSPDTPAALIARGTWETQTSVRGRLSELALLADRAGIEAPATLVVGEVVELGASVPEPELAAAG